MPLHAIRIHAEAPAKPAHGTPCNGCGLCCLFEPCPAAQLLTLKRRGSCRLLHWDETSRRYRCGLIENASSTWLGRLQRRLAMRWVAAGVGCDAELQVSTPP